MCIRDRQYTLLSNRIPVIGVGNEADQRHHFYSEIMNTSDTKTVEIRVGENTTGFMMELWTELPNILSISLTSPSGAVSYTHLDVYKRQILTILIQCRRTDTVQLASCQHWL